MDKRQRINRRGEWEKTLSSKFQDYEPALPGLPPFHLHKQRRPHISRWTWLALPSSIAATIILAIFLTRTNTQEPIKPLSISSSDYVIAEIDDQIIETATAPKNLPATQSTRSNQILDEAKKPKRAVVEDCASNEVTSDNICETVVQKNDNSISEKEYTAEDLPSIQPKEYTGNSRKTSPQIKKNLKLSLFTSGLTLNTDAVVLSQMGDGIIADEKDNYSVQETPLFEIGASILFPLTQKLFIQSGVKYIWYRIEVKDNSFHIKNNHILDVHSLGIPLDIQYTLYDSKAWRAYGQYGVGVNIPFKSTIGGESINNGGATISLDTSLGLGLEYRITGQVGVYSSFGVTYDLLQMKSDLPDADISMWHGKLEAGIRFRVGR